MISLDLEEGELLVYVDRANDFTREAGFASDRADDVTRSDSMHSACRQEEAGEALICDNQISRGAPSSGARFGAALGLRSHDLSREETQEIFDQLCRLRHFFHELRGQAREALVIVILCKGREVLSELQPRLLFFFIIIIEVIGVELCFSDGRFFRDHRRAPAAAARSADPGPGQCRRGCVVGRIGN